MGPRRDVGLISGIRYCLLGHSCRSIMRARYVHNSAIAHLVHPYLFSSVHFFFNVRVSTLHIVYAGRAYNESNESYDAEITCVCIVLRQCSSTLCVRSIEIAIELCPVKVVTPPRVSLAIRQEYF